MRATEKSENAGVENAGADSRGGKCKSIACSRISKAEPILYIERPLGYFLKLS